MREPAALDEREARVLYWSQMVSTKDEWAPPGGTVPGVAGALGGAERVPVNEPATLTKPRAEELLRQLLPTRVVAQLLGVSTATVERAIRSGQLPVLHFRRKRYVNIDDLVSFMREPTRHTSKQGMDVAIASILRSVQR